MVAENATLPYREDWDTNCVPLESFLGPHPAVGGGLQARRLLQPQQALPGAGSGSGNGARRRLLSPWLGGACFFGFLTPVQLRALPYHYAPLTFVASEGALPDVLPLDLPFAMVRPPCCAVPCRAVHYAWRAAASAQRSPCRAAPGEGGSLWPLAADGV